MAYDLDRVSEAFGALDAHDPRAVELAIIRILADGTETRPVAHAFRHEPNATGVARYGVRTLGRDPNNGGFPELVGLSYGQALVAVTIIGQVAAASGDRVILEAVEPWDLR